MTKNDFHYKWQKIFASKRYGGKPMILSAIEQQELLDDSLSLKFSFYIFEKKLEKDNGLITEAISDIVIISKLNDEESARELIKKQFLVINRQDMND